MRHRKAYRKFGLPSDQRRALLKGLTRSLLLYDRILTTETRAKEVRPIVEKLVTLARKGGTDAPVPLRVHTRRLVRQYVDSNVDEFVKVPNKSGKGHKVQRNPYYVVPRLFEEIAPRYKNRNGGYTRITKYGFRRGDGAPLVLLEFVEGEAVEVTAGAGNALVPSANGRRGLHGLARGRK
jgi:large subunit ribosomal protein L17